MASSFSKTKGQRKMNAQTKTATKADLPASEPKAAQPLTVIRRDDIATESTIRPVVQAIAHVMAKVGSVEKRGRNDFHKYDYATAADVAHALQQIMAEYGLVIVQREIGVNHDHETGILAVRYEFTVMHRSGDALEPVQMTGMSRARDSKGGFDDKAANKCHTAARKYFLLGLFQIPSGDFPDPDADETPPAKQEPKKQTQQNGNGQKAEPQNQQTQQKPADQKQDHPFALITGDGVELTYSNGTEYLAGMERAFQEAADKVGFWDSNKVHFDSWMFKLIKVGNNKKAIDEFSRVSKEITDTVFLLTSQKGA
jgi:hypothetical protein